MTNLRKRLIVLSIAGGVGLILASVAAANDRGVDGRGGPIGGGGLGGPRGSLNTQCRQNCRQTDRLCLESAQSDFRMCVHSTCVAEQQTAESTCEASGYRSTDCRDARSALNTCAQPCRATLMTAVGSCRSADQTCEAACATSTPTQPDAQCVAGCRSSLQSCRLSARTAEFSCFGDCKSLIERLHNRRASGACLRRAVQSNRGERGAVVLASGADLCRRLLGRVGDAYAHSRLVKAVDSPSARAVVTRAAVSTARCGQVVRI